MDGALHKAIENFMAYVNAQGSLGSPTSEQIASIAQRLVQLATNPSWQEGIYRSAAPHEELLYELAVSPNSGPSLYLVSDGQFVVSPPHEHNTWAVIAGIRGTEINRLYKAQSMSPKVACELEIVEIRYGESLILQTDQIHSTEVNASEASFHLHLYGQPLHTLPSFTSRSYSIARGA